MKLNIGLWNGESVKVKVNIVLHNYKFNKKVKFVVFTATGQHQNMKYDPQTRSVSPTYEIPMREPDQQSNVVYQDLLPREPAETPLIYVNI